MSAQDYGTVEFEGVTYTLTEQPEMDNYGTEGAVRYYAKATDGDGNEYRVAWDTTVAWDMAQERIRLQEAERRPVERGGGLDDEDAERLAVLEAMSLPNYEDESLACDWDNPAAVTPL